MFEMSPMQAINPIVCQSGIFIVGMPCSGAQMLSSLLNRHSKLACGPETHFYDQLKPSDIVDALADPQWPKKAANLIASLVINKRSVLEVYGFTPSHIYQKLIKLAPTRANMFLAIQYLYLKEVNKQIWIEKTSQHFLQINTIIEDFPNAKIVLLTRDTNELAKSLVGLPEAFKSVYANTAKLADLQSKSKNSVLNSPQILKIRYEELTEDIRVTLAKVCRHIGVAFEHQMIGENSLTALMSLDASRFRQGNYGSNSAVDLKCYKQVKSESVTFTYQRHIENFEPPVCEASSQATVRCQLLKHNHLSDSIKNLGLVVTRESKFAGLDDVLDDLIPAGCKVFLYDQQCAIDKGHNNTSTILVYLEGSFFVRCKLMLKALKAKFLYGHTLVYSPHQPNLNWWRYVLFLLFTKY